MSHDDGGATKVSGNFTGLITPDGDNLIIDAKINWLAGAGRLAGASGAAEAHVIQGPFDNAGVAVHAYKYRGVFVLP